MLKADISFEKLGYDHQERRKTIIKSLGVSAPRSISQSLEVYNPQGWEVKWSLCVNSSASFPKKDQQHHKHIGYSPNPR
jgi:hypothetical protein